MIHTVLITRPQPGADRLAAALKRGGYEPVTAPVLEVVPLENPDLPPLADIDALIFTSANGVRFFAECTPVRDLPVYAVGDVTHDTAQARGFNPVFSAGADSDSLARMLCETLPAGMRLLHAAGERVAGHLPETLGAAGIEYTRCNLYRTQPIDALPQTLVSVIKGRTINAAMFFSPATAEAFVRLYKQAGLADESTAITALCMSDAVAEAAGQLGWGACHVAEHPSQADMLRLLDDLNGLGPH